MQEHLLQPLKDLFETEFRLVNGCVIAYLPGRSEPEPTVWGSGSAKLAQNENQRNHRHFDFSIGATAYERWQNNLTLAVSVETFWKNKLALDFPGRGFRFIIWNELAASVDENEKYLDVEIVPALRMWSLMNDPDMEMHRAFCVDESSLEKICLNVDCRPVFIPIEEVFTRKGSIRKNFLSRGIGAGRLYLDF